MQPGGSVLPPSDSDQWFHFGELCTRRQLLPQFL